METTKYSKSEMPKMSEANAEHPKYFKRNDVLPLDSIHEAVRKLVQTIKQSPQKKCAIFLDNDESSILDLTGKQHESFSDWLIGNYNVFDIDVLTNRVDLIVYFDAANNSNELERFKSLENYKLYEEDNRGYMVHCGEDVEMVAYLFSEFITKVWQPKSVAKFRCGDFEEFSFDNIELYVNAKQPIKDKITAYNEAAAINDYPEFSYDSARQLLKGSFPTERKVGGFFSKSSRTHKKMKNDYDKILKFCLSSLAY